MILTSILPELQPQRVSLCAHTPFMSSAKEDDQTRRNQSDLSDGSDGSDDRARTRNFSFGRSNFIEF
jgi:hypothetical protein